MSVIQFETVIEDDIIRIPERYRGQTSTNVEVTLVSMEKPRFRKETIAQKQHEAFERFFAAIDAIDDEPITEEDFLNFNKNRVNFIRELNL